MRFAALFLVLAFTAPLSFGAFGSSGPQEPGYTELARKCGSNVKWAANDTWQPKDGQPEARPGKEASQVDRMALWTDAKAKAKESGRLILWYAFRVQGVQMYRSPLPDGYMLQMFSDPDLAELVNRRFIPVRLFADAALGGETGIKALEFVEPGLIVCDTEGKILHKIDRIRTFNPDWFVAWLVAVLQKSAKDKPAGTAEELMLAGHYDAAKAALEKAANPYLSACLKRRMHDYDGALAALGQAKSGDGLTETERGLIHLRNAKFDDAKKCLEDAAKIKSAEEVNRILREHLAGHSKRGAV